MELKALYPDRDEDFYHIAWSWRKSYPRLVRQWDMVTSFEQWMGMMTKRVSIGVFTERLVALITLEPIGSGIYEAHVDVERRINMDQLYSALMNIQRVVFTRWHANEVFVGVISRNRAIIRLAEACGFQRDGIEETYHNLRWIRMRITASEYESQRKAA